MTQEELDRILADPLASREDVIRVFHAGAKEVGLSHPNCPPDYWWVWAKEHPFTAMSSPLFPLLTLEDPAQWEDVTRRNYLTWLTWPQVHWLSSVHWYHLWADILERAAPIFLRSSPYSSDAITQAARGYRRVSTENMGERALQDFIKSARDLRDEMEWNHDRWKKRSEMERYTSMAILDAAIAHSPQQAMKKLIVDTHTQPASYNEYLYWVWQRLVWYWHQEQEATP